MNEPFPRGAVVVSGDLVGSRSKRPFVLISTEAHPFYGEEYTAIPLTTTSRSAAFELTETRFREGGLPRRSYALPWNIATLKHEGVSTHAGTLTQEATETLVEQAIGYLREDPP
ncbi:mRNA interferase PemK [Natronococcus occultus]|uniref:PemK-like protein n=1 Tax=Natronococcus occultus SP4 TaxID=694430 RepID=L0K131_9EURY|nr:mRNA interferase PemK [Natronococcus occultus]AGB38706.1 PemK-like protein [Natronococcus occultus SP4]